MSGVCHFPPAALATIVGHKTEAIYRRYAITDEAMLKEGAEKLARLHATVGGGSPTTLLPFKAVR